MNPKQGQAFELFMAHALTLLFFLPHRNGIQTLGWRKEIALEIERPRHSHDWVKRYAHAGDLAEADAVFVAVEGML